MDYLQVPQVYVDSQTQRQVSFKELQVDQDMENENRHMIDK